MLDQLKSCSCSFFTSCIHQLKIYRIWKRALVVSIPKLYQPLGRLKELSPCISTVRPLQDPRDTHLRYCQTDHRFITPHNNSSVHINTNAVLWMDHWWNAEWLKNATRLHTFIPDIGTHLPEMVLLRTEWVWTKPPPHWYRIFPLLLAQIGSWPFLQLVSVAQKNRPLIMSSTVQSINLHMDCIAWRFWTMRPSNGW